MIAAPRRNIIINVAIASIKLLISLNRRLAADVTRHRHVLASIWCRGLRSRPSRLINPPWHCLSPRRLPERLINSVRNYVPPLPLSLSLSHSIWTIPEIIRESTRPVLKSQETREFTIILASRNMVRMRFEYRESRIENSEGAILSR